MNALAAFTILLAAGTWIGIRFSETSQRIDHDIATFLLSLPVKDWQDDVDGRRW